MKRFVYFALMALSVISCKEKIGPEGGSDGPDPSVSVATGKFELTGNYAYLTGNLSVSEKDRANVSAVYFLLSKDSEVPADGTETKIVARLDGESFAAPAPALAATSKYYFKAEAVIGGKTYSSPVNGFETGEEMVPVDIGLVVNGKTVKWASMNLGAASQADYGDHYSWGEIEPKSDFDWKTYKWGAKNTELTKYVSTDSYGPVDNKTQLDPEDDAAAVKLGGKWRMPTKEELDALDAIKDNPGPTRSWEFVWQDGAKDNGLRITYHASETAVSTLFFSTPGYFEKGVENSSVGSFFTCWSSSRNMIYSDDAYDFRFGVGSWSWSQRSSGPRNCGRSIRAVYVED